MRFPKRKTRLGNGAPGALLMNVNSMSLSPNAYPVMPAATSAALRPKMIGPGKLTLSSHTVVNAFRAWVTTCTRARPSASGTSVTVPETVVPRSGPLTLLIHDVLENARI